MRSHPLLWIGISALFVAACGEGSLTSDEAYSSTEPTDESYDDSSDDPLSETSQQGIVVSYCPQYASSPLYRPRARQVTVGPANDWVGAIRGAVAGTEVLLRDGTYEMRGAYSVTVPASVTVRSLSGNAARVTIRNVGYGTASEGLMVVGADVTIADLTIKEVLDHAVSVKGELGAHRVQLYNLTLKDIGTKHIKATPGSQNGLVACSRFSYSGGRQRGDAVGAIALSGATGWTLRDNRVTGIVGDGTGCVVDANCSPRPRGAPIEVGEASRSVVIERNTLINNWRGIVLGANDGATVRNNFISRRVAGLTGIELNAAHNTLVAHNTVRVSNHPNALEAWSSNGLRVLNNYTSAALRDMGGAPLGGSGNLTDAVDADFVATNDVHVRDGNRALGRGFRLDSVNSDIEGEPFNGRWDAGADHGVAVGAPPPPPTAPPTVAPPPPGGVDYCPPYVQSPVFRARARQVVVGPADAWMDTIANATAGTEVLLRDGTYNHNRYTVTIPGDVTVRGQSGNRSAVLIRGRGYAVDSEAFTLSHPNSTVADLSMTQFRNHAISIKGELNAENPNLYNLHLYDIGTDHIKVTIGGVSNGLVACSSIGYTTRAVGDYIDGIDLMQGTNWIIRDSDFYNIYGDKTGCEVDYGCWNEYIDGPAILVWRGSRGTIIERNVFINNFRAINIGLGTPDDGSIVRNNFIYREGVGDVGIGLQNATNALVVNNTILNYQYRAGIEVQAGQNVRILDNLVNTALWDRGGNSGLDVRGNLWDARSTDLLAPNDYHLRAGSRAIGTGVQVDTPADIDGEPFNGRYDVGCDHFGG